MEDYVEQLGATVNDTKGGSTNGEPSALKYLGYCKNKGVVLREEGVNREKQGEEALTLAQDDADPRHWRRADASAEAADESVGNAGSRRGGRGRDEHARGSGDKQVRFKK